MRETIFRSVSLQGEFLAVCLSLIVLLAGCGHVPVAAALWQKLQIIIIVR